jgi:hypothetical protein
MRQVREVPRLKTAGVGLNEIARRVGVAPSTVRLTLKRLASAGFDWPLPADLTDGALEAMLYAGHGSQHGARRKAEPDWAYVHHELRRPGVTLMLLWEEYRQQEPGGYRYSRWCELYRAWEGRLSPTMRQVHPAGERMFVDYAGQTVDLIDGGTGEIQPAQIFVAVMGASNYTYAEATLTQTLPDWIGGMSGRWPSWAACRRSSCPTTRRSGSIAPTGTSLASTALISVWRPITAPLSCRRAHGCVPWSGVGAVGK